MTKEQAARFPAVVIRQAIEEFTEWGESPMTPAEELTFSLIKLAHVLYNQNGYLPSRLERVCRMPPETLLAILSGHIRNMSLARLCSVFRLWNVKPQLKPLYLRMELYDAGDDYMPKVKVGLKIPETKSFKRDSVASLFVKEKPSFLKKAYEREAQKMSWGELMESLIPPGGKIIGIEDLRAQWMARKEP